MTPYCEYFDFHPSLYITHGGKKAMEGWQTLVHVCRRWRSLILCSPRRLNLQLFCTPDTPVTDNLDIWPPLPLIVVGDATTLSSGTDNTIAALEQNNRVREVILWDLFDWQMEESLAAMKAPFPELTKLELHTGEEESLPIPDSFLGGSAPRSLQHFELFGISFPGLPKLLSSADHLVHLALLEIPDSGYISPEAMVALISTLSSLRSLTLRFEVPGYLPGWENRSLPPPKRSILPALEKLDFQGVIKYLEVLLTFIEAPQMNHTFITFFDQTYFDCPRLAQFINCTPTLRAVKEAHVQFADYTAIVKLYQTSTSNPFGLWIEIICSNEPDLQFSTIERLCSPFLRTISTLEDLYIEHEYSLAERGEIGAIENALWLQLLLPFLSVKDLYISEDFAPGIAKALKELDGARITEVLPSLQNIFVEWFKPLGAFQKKVGKFVAARQLSGQPIAISVWNKKYHGNMQPW